MKVDRTYIDPSVNIISRAQYSDELGFYVWLKSRRKVISLDISGQRERISDVLLTDDHSHPISFLLYSGAKVTLCNSSKFYVDNELVSYDSYKYRIINTMNLQYNNIPYYVFEIQGSALFRDFLYVINWTGQFAESNRFLFSILPDNAVLDSKNYHISSEYKDIPEWEDQFDRYMEKIHETQVTDENRTEMPYSISSFFWWSCNYKTLINVLSLMKLKFPFFYKTYGLKIMKESSIVENDLKSYVDASLLQYFRSDDWEKGSIKKSGMYIIDTEISYIILSQFLRQSPSVIAGLYSDLEHSDPDEFSHKVFKGDTVCRISFTCHESKLRKTVSTRSCNFAANSGSGVGSWSGFLNDFISGISTPDEVRELLPCEFNKDHTLKFCPLYDDVKFRNTGLESRNCVCPLLTASLDDAVKKMDRDQNLLSRWFYELTKDLVNAGGVPYIHKLND